PRVERAHRGGAHCGDPGLHVARAAAVYAAVAHVAVERRMRHVVDADDVQVAVEHQASSVAAADACNEIRTPGNGVAQLRLETPAAQDLGQRARNRGLARTTRYERRIA